MRGKSHDRHIPTGPVAATLMLAVRLSAGGRARLTQKFEAMSGRCHGG